jgi:putative serine protease PepD
MSYNPSPPPRPTFSTNTTSSAVPDRPVEPRRRRRAWMAVPVALAVAAAGFAGGAIGATFEQESAPVIIERTQPTRVITAQPATATVTPDTAEVGTAVIPSIVTVEVGSEANGVFVPGGSGSGVILDTAGNIATNDHVVDGGAAIRVILSDGRIYDADLIGTDPLTDLAVLNISANDLTPIALGSADDLTIGVTAIAVGSPLGLEGGPSLSVGVVSALGREVQTGPETILYGMIQTDAPITSGSSGGSLVDADGALIGITTAVGVSNIGVEGIGFATPVEIVERVTNEIIATGSVSHALLGITGDTAYDSTEDGGSVPVGVNVREVTPGSAADAAGIVVGDVITAVDGIDVLTMDELITALRRVGGGESITVSLSNGQIVTTTVASR